MSEQQVNQVPPSPPEDTTQKTVTAESVLLSAVELAQSRGAYKVNEMALITEAHRIVTAQEDAKKKASEAARIAAQPSAQPSAEPSAEEMEQAD
jgi:hypothetical protein|tara:strand:- start:34 stop:315 length:282 start_codon:yes stop_codon:yes gene_type:complete